MHPRLQQRKEKYAFLDAFTTQAVAMIGETRPTTELRA